MKYVFITLLIFCCSECFGERKYPDTTYVDMFLNVRPKSNAYYFIVIDKMRDTVSHYFAKVCYIDGRVRGTAEFQGNKRNAMPVGKAITYFENGQQEVVIDYRGKDTVKSYRYHANGTKAFESTTVDDKLQGFADYPSGFKRREINYVEGKMEGTLLEYCDSSNEIWIKSNYKDGVPDGPEIVYFKNGHVRSMKYFSHGNEVSYTCFDKYGHRLNSNSAHVIPEFIGGAEGYEQYLKDNIDFPKLCRKNRIGGSVWVYAYIDESGKVYDVALHNRANPLFDAEALRLVRNSPKFVPALDEDGNPVRGQRCLNVIFKGAISSSDERMIHGLPFKFYF